MDRGRWSQISIFRRGRVWDTAPRPTHPGQIACPKRPCWAMLGYDLGAGHGRGSIRSVCGRSTSKSGGTTTPLPDTPLMHHGFLLSLQPSTVRIQMQLCSPRVRIRFVKIHKCFDISYINSLFKYRNINNKYFEFLFIRNQKIANYCTMQSSELLSSRKNQHK